MVFKILHSRIEEFLSRIPSGRIINRFTNDLESIDRKLGGQWGSLIWSFCNFAVAAVFYGFLIGAEVMICMLLMTIFSYWLQRKYMSIKREFTRLESITKTPVISHYTDTVKGLPFIRGYGKTDMFFDNFVKKLEENCCNSVVIFGLNSWYQLRILLVSLVVVMIPSYAILIFLKDNLVIEDVVVFLSLGTMLSNNLSMLLDNAGIFETAMVSVERCSHLENIQSEKQYHNLDQEAKYATGTKSDFDKMVKERKKNRETVVTEGKITLKNVFAKYATNPNPVLKDLTLEISPGEKIGVIGRTGSGKSTLVKLLWRSMDPDVGKIYVDSKDITTVDLKSYRSQIMVVSQETALIQGTLRENIDITLENSSQDALITQVLTNIGFTNADFLKSKLDMKVSSDGSNLSAGEKQIISFARAVISKRKILILDEATANIDLKTEEFIQKAMDEEFKDSTVIVIAHRLQTILKSDRILVLDEGKILAFDTPQALLSMEDSYLRNILNKMMTEED